MSRSISSPGAIAPILFSLALSACGGGTESATQAVAGERGTAAVTPTVIGSTAPSWEADLAAEERSLAFRNSLDPARVGHYGIGERASDEVIAGWDIDVRPDGEGLPPGSGSAETGEPLYEEKCSECHGIFGEGSGRWPKLAGREDLTGSRPEKTVGNYWPYATTLWDYINRAMPFYEPRSLDSDEVYAITAYVLYLNDLLEYDQILDQDNLAAVQMPNRDGFSPDPRPDVQNVACTDNCKNPADIKITWDSTELGVTPVEHFKDDDTGEDSEGSSIKPEQVYANACKTCHDAGLAGAPIRGNAEQWQPRLVQGIDVLVRHAIEGYQGESGFMPPKGGQAQLSDEEVAAAVQFMVKAL